MFPLDPFRYASKGCFFLRTFQKFRCEVYPSYFRPCSARSDGSDASTTCYVERMLVAIGMNWFKPAQAGTVSPVIHFRIEKDGSISDATVERSSGLPFVDRAALRAVVSSSPLPPLPAEYGGSHLGVHLKFD